MRAIPFDCPGKPRTLTDVETPVKKYSEDLLTRTDKVADAREMCLTRLRAVPREKREAAADAILALADPEWWERRHKGSEVFMLILELRRDAVMKILKDAGALGK